MATETETDMECPPTASVIPGGTQVASVCLKTVVTKGTPPTCMCLQACSDGLHTLVPMTVSTLCPLLRVFSPGAFWVHRRGVVDNLGRLWCEGGVRKHAHHF